MSFKDFASSRPSAVELRQRARSAARRRLADMAPVQRVARSLVAARNEVDPAPASLLTMYERMRERFAPEIPSAGHDTPSTGDVERLQRAITRSDMIHRGFFRLARDHGSLAEAAVRSTRMLLEDENWGVARSFAQVLQRYDDLRPVADICLALGAEIAPLPLTVRDFLSRNDVGFVLAQVPDLYFRSGFELDPGPTAATLRRALDGELTIVADAALWTDIAVSSFSAGEEELAGRALDRADSLRASMQNAQAARPLELRSAALRRYLDRGRQAPAEAGVSIALLAHHHPDRRHASRRLTDSMHTLAVFEHLARHRNADLVGDPALAKLAASARESAPAERLVDGAPVSVALSVVDRDAAYAAVVPDGTWVIWSGRYGQPLHGTHFAPANPALRPIFVGLDLDTAVLSDPGVAAQLRAHAPVGCLNWDTVFLLLGAGIPAFFSGPVPATLDATGAAERSGTLVVDSRSGPGRLSLEAQNAPERGLANLLERAGKATSEIARAERVVTPDLTAYLVARGLGVDAELAPAIPWSPNHPSLVTLSNEEFGRMREALSAKLTAVLGSILAGDAAEKVYATWDGLCADDVAAARARVEAGNTQPRLNFDPAVLSDAIREASVTVERTDHDVEGEEINVEFSLDGGYKRQLDIVLDSVVSRTRRPVRAFILCREHGPADFERMARLFPSVSFVWLTTDNVVYGPIAGKVPWASFATMDRTLLPLIAPQIDRILHLDLDLLVLGDLGELFDWPVGDKPLAAIVEAQNRFRSGYDTIRRAADRLRGSGQPDLAEQLTTTVFARHPFDFTVFNAGVMLMNLDRMRKDDFCNQILGFVQHFGVNGQEVLNIYVGDDFERVEMHWNSLVRLEMWDAPNIAHWAGPRKPWKGIWVTGREEWQVAERAFDERTAAIG